jgi:hypothetical protein
MQPFICSIARDWETQIRQSYAEMRMSYDLVLPAPPRLTLMQGFIHVSEGPGTQSVEWMGRCGVNRLRWVVGRVQNNFSLHTVGTSADCNVTSELIQ